MGGTNQPGESFEIVVRGYSPRYVAAVRKLLGIEGGHSNDPVDRGGETKFGISLRFLKAEGGIDADGDGLADFDLDMDGDIDGRDIRLLTVGDAVWLYHYYFWKPLGAEQLEAPIGEMLFDQAVNGGLSSAQKLLQRAINACNAHVSDAPRLTVDGVAGPRTLLAMASVLEHPGLGMRALAEAYREQARARYRAIAAADPSQGRFLKGWLRRADELGR
jgi:lysozyme family protein